MISDLVIIINHFNELVVEFKAENKERKPFGGRIAKNIFKLNKRPRFYIVSGSLSKPLFVVLNLYFPG